MLLAHFVIAYGLMACADLATGAARWVPMGIMYLGFILMGLGRGWMFADANVLYAIASEAKRPSYIVVGRTISNGVAVGVMLLAAALGSRALPYGALFAGLAAAFLFASLFVVFAVRTREEEAPPPEA